MNYESTTRYERGGRGTVAIDDLGELPATGEVRKLTKQTFLVGPSIYLRPLELGDAASAPFWSNCPFPVSADVMEERLKEDVPSASASGTRRLVACRRNDDMPMGSVEMSSEDGRTSDLSFCVPEVFGPTRRSEITAEMIRLTVPWQL